MKRLVSFVLLTILLVVTSYAAEAEKSILEEAFPFKYDRPAEPDPEQLAIANFVLNYGMQQTTSSLLMNVLPAVQWGNTPEQNTPEQRAVRIERFRIATMDGINRGVQVYLFKDTHFKDKNLQVKPVDFASLNAQEKEICYIFMHLLFNKSYKVKLLDKKNIERLQTDKDFYFSYISQVVAELGLEGQQ